MNGSTYESARKYCNSLKYIKTFIIASLFNLSVGTDVTCLVIMNINSIFTIRMKKKNLILPYNLFFQESENKLLLSVNIRGSFEFKIILKCHFDAVHWWLPLCFSFEQTSRFFIFRFISRSYSSLCS